jgi:hypothetical protein
MGVLKGLICTSVSKSCFNVIIKYIKIDYHSVRERIANKLLDIKFISSKGCRGFYKGIGR